MLYSSAHTGRPKGVKRMPRRASSTPPFDKPKPLANLGDGALRWTPDTVLICRSATLYHAAPIGWSTAGPAMGGTVVMMWSALEAPRTALRFHRAVQDHLGPVGPTHFMRCEAAPPPGGGGAGKPAPATDVPH